MRCPSRGAGWAAMSGRSARAFTLIELLVVVGLIGLLLALLLPAVQAAREVGRRAGCGNNLRQIGIALQSYEATHGMFPPVDMGSLGSRGPNMMSGLTYLLPALEQGPLYDAINFNFAHLENSDSPSLENHTARNTRVATFLCPSDGSQRAFNNYRFNRGRNDGRLSPSLLFDGPFNQCLLPRAAAITDGLSRTAFVSERLGGSFSDVSFVSTRDVMNPSHEEGVLLTSDADLEALCQAAPAASWFTRSGRYWMYTGPLNGSYNHNGPPNAHRPSCGAGFILIGFGFHPPRSGHPGAVLVLLGDGHVEAVADGVQPSVWAALGTYNANDL